MHFQTEHDWRASLTRLLGPTNPSPQGRRTPPRLERKVLRRDQLSASKPIRITQVSR